ncbi:MAG: metallophosphoesterase [Sphingobacteriaceae bacterium]|nr:metallophosphoesterase [Sphingobacteriaceae bacterium]
MQAKLALSWSGITWILDASGSCFIPEFETLIISDFHVGKVQHFRKHGIAIPLAAARANLGKLQWVLAKYEPKKLLFLGDLFHSDVNSELGLLQELRTIHPSLEILVVPGNHDRYSLTAQGGLFTITPEQFHMGGIIFQHHPPEQEVNEPTVHGHWHPAIQLRGKGRQRMRLACFAFSAKTAVMPAFGLFTGKADLPSLPFWEQVVVLSKEGIEHIPPGLLR